MFDWTNFAGYPNELTNAEARNQFKSPNDVATDSSGAVYVTDPGHFRICKVLPSGQVVVVAGGTQGSTDGAGATAEFNDPYGIAVDGQGNLYVTDNHTVRKVTPQGAVTTLAGMPGESGAVDGAGAAARFGPLRGIAVTSNGVIFLPDPANHTLRKITPEGQVTTFAGKAGTEGHVQGTGGTIRFKQPSDVTLDNLGNLYVADTGNDAIRKLPTVGSSSTLASWNFHNEWFVYPAHIVWARNQLFVTDEAYGVVYQIDPTRGDKSIVAGVKGRHGTADGGVGTSRFHNPRGLAANSIGDIYIADNISNTLRKLSFSNQLTTVAGSVGSRGSADGQGSSARFLWPSALCVQPDGQIYVADSGNGTIRKITPEGLVSTFAGIVGAHGLMNSSEGDSHVGGLSDMALSRNGYLLTVQASDHEVSKVNMDGTIQKAYDLFQERPVAITETPDGNVYIIDENTDSICRATRQLPQLIPTRVAGGVRGDQDGLGTAARFNQPRGLFSDASGNLYVADTGNHKIRKIAPDGQVTTIMGPEDGLSSPQGVIVDAAGNIYVADTGNHVIRMRGASGVVSIIGGTPGNIGGQDGRAMNAGFCSPQALALDGDGGLYVVDWQNHRIVRGSPAAATAPALELEGPGDATVAEGALVDLGILTTVQSKQYAFTLRNTGTSTINLTGSPRVQIQSSNAPFFASLSSTAPLSPGADRVVYLSLGLGLVVGVHEGEVFIPSDDPGRPLLSFRVKLEVVAPAQVSFDASRYVVNQGTEELLVPVSRTGRTSAFSVKLRTTELNPTSVPPFSTGVGEVDFQPLSLTLDFAEGEMTKQIPVTLIPRGGTGVPNLRFALILTDASDGNTASPRAFAEIQVLAEDMLAPTLALTSPSAKDKHLVLPRRITGTAGDAMGLDRVEVSLNGGEPVRATLHSATQSTSVNFSAEVLEDDSSESVLTVTAYDLKGNSTVLTRTFERHFLVRLQRQFLPNSTVPANVGKFTVTGSPKGWGSATSHTGFPAVLAGSRISISTTIPAGYLFHHWENAPAGADPTSHTISFTVPETGVSPMTAVFSANPFLKGAALHYGGGNLAYLGLILPTGDTERSNASVGQFTATLVQATASLSGKLLMNGGIHAFTALLNGDGTVWFKTGKTFVSELELPGLRLSMTWSEVGLQATVRGSAENVSEGLASPAHFHKNFLVPRALLNLSASQGYYTLAWPAKAQLPIRDVKTFPQGAGYAALTFSNQGKVSLVGVLADGTKITASSLYRPSRQVPVFVQIPTPGASAKVKGGSFVGTLLVNPDEGAVSGEGCLWFRPAVVETPKPVTQLYTAGWPDGLQVDTIGSAFQPRLTVQQILPTTTGATVLRFENGRLVSPVEKQNLTILGNKVIKTPANDKTVTLKVSPVTGLFSGSFEPDWAQPQKKQPVFQGILLQGTEPSGVGFFISNGMADTDPEAGAVSLSGADR
ncbi:hypothetical protein GCM10023213_27220 [Prosthecobacter algae]|uniref:Bacterial repeat domain-containing protein n=1 Tax=Prosthecobacter algae TaxID=1144682 RepID=A0ABP9P7Y9_9BACT